MVIHSCVVPDDGRSFLLKGLGMNKLKAYYEKWLSRDLFCDQNL